MECKMARVLLIVGKCSGDTTVVKAKVFRFAWLTTIWDGQANYRDGEC